jgi:hypothetical protein
VRFCVDMCWCDGSICGGAFVDAWGTTFCFSCPFARYGLLQFLTMEQALADYAVLIDYLKATTPGANTSAVIAFGGSYGGDVVVVVVGGGWLLWAASLSWRRPTTTHIRWQRRLKPLQCVCGALAPPWYAPPLFVGMLASWFRMKYPGSVDGAIAASAPILQFTGLTDPTVYSAITTQTYRDVSPLCASGIEASWAVMQKLGSTTQGLVELSGEDG